MQWIAVDTGREGFSYIGVTLSCWLDYMQCDPANCCACVCAKQSARVLDVRVRALRVAADDSTFLSALSEGACARLFLLLISFMLDNVSKHRA